MTEYFDVKDIKENHPELKIDIKKVLIVGRNIYIKAENIQEITEFDKVFKGLFKTKN
jgi:Holliday junction resolvase